MTATMGAFVRASWFKAFTIAALTAGFLNIPLLAQSAQIRPSTEATQPAARLYRIAGIVSDAVTHEPIDGTTLTLIEEQPPRSTLRTMVTGADGHFELDPVPAGKYALHASRRGYVAAFFDEHELYSSAIVTGEDQDTEHIPFQLNPGAVIRGVVTDDAGEPIDQATVLLMRRTKEGGLGERLAKTISGTTDDTGLFEYWNLDPGTYFLAVKADPWFALHPLQTRQQENTSADQREAAAALDVAYPVTFYASATDQDAATPISVKSGDRVQADIALHAVPAIHLTVHSAETNDGDSSNRRLRNPPILRQTIFGDQDTSIFAAAQPGPPGSGLMEFTGLAPGRYSISQGSPPRVTEIDTAGNQQLDLSSGAPTVNIEMKVRMADGSLTPKSLEVVLVSDDSESYFASRRITARMVEGSVVHVESVPAGRWNVLVGSNKLSFAVISVQSGATAMADSRIVVKDKPMSLTAVLAQGKTSIEGFAKKDGKGEPGVMIVLVPKNPAAHLAQFRRDQSDSDGSFSLRDATPGEYTVVAIEDGWELSWARPEVIAHYLAGGVDITIPANAGSTMRLNASVAVQAR